MDIITPTDFVSLVALFLNFIQKIGIPLIFTLALVFALWKIIDVWIINGGDSTKVQEGKQSIFWIILTLVVMAGVWGIIAILRSSIGG